MNKDWEGVRSPVERPQKDPDRNDRIARPWVEVTFDCFAPTSDDHLEMRSDLEDVLTHSVAPAEGCHEGEDPRRRTKIDFVFDPGAHDDTWSTGTY